MSANLFGLPAVTGQDFDDANDGIYLGRLSTLPQDRRLPTGFLAGKILSLSVGTGPVALDLSSYSDDLTVELFSASADFTITFAGSLKTGRTLTVMNAGTFSASVIFSSLTNAGPTGLTPAGVGLWNFSSTFALGRRMPGAYAGSGWDLGTGPVAMGALTAASLKGTNLAGGGTRPLQTDNAGNVSGVAGTASYWDAQQGYKATLVANTWYKVGESSDPGTVKTTGPFRLAMHSNIFGGGEFTINGQGTTGSLVCTGWAGAGSPGLRPFSAIKLVDNSVWVKTDATDGATQWEFEISDFLASRHPVSPLTWIFDLTTTSATEPVGAYLNRSLPLTGDPGMMGSPDIPYFAGIAGEAAPVVAGRKSVYKGADGKLTASDEVPVEQYTASITNYDLALTPGLYYAPNGATNAPAGGNNYAVQVQTAVGSPNARVLQTAFLLDSFGGELYSRSRLTNGTWTTWHRLDAGNIPSTAGLYIVRTGAEFLAAANSTVEVSRVILVVQDDVSVTTNPTFRDHMIVLGYPVSFSSAVTSFLNAGSHSIQLVDFLNAGISLGAPTGTFTTDKIVRTRKLTTMNSLTLAGPGALLYEKLISGSVPTGATNSYWDNTASPSAISSTKYSIVTTTSPTTAADWNALRNGLYYRTSGGSIVLTLVVESGTYSPDTGDWMDFQTRGGTITLSWPIGVTINGVPGANTQNLGLSETAVCRLVRLSANTYQLMYPQITGGGSSQETWQLSRYINTAPASPYSVGIGDSGMRDGTNGGNVIPIKVNGSYSNLVCVVNGFAANYNATKNVTVQVEESSTGLPASWSLIGSSVSVTVFRTEGAPQTITIGSLSTAGKFYRLRIADGAGVATGDMILAQFRFY